MNDNLERCLRLLLNSNSVQNEWRKTNNDQSAKPFVLVSLSNKQINAKTKPVITIPVTLLAQKHIQPLKIVTGTSTTSEPYRTQSLPVFTLSSNQLNSGNTVTLNEVGSNALQIVSIPQSVIQQLQSNSSTTQSANTGSQPVQTPTPKPKSKPKPRSTAQRLTTARVLYQQSCNTADKEDSPTIASTLAYCPRNANPVGFTTVDGINLQEIKEFAKLFKMRRLALGLTQTQVGQALSAAKGPAYSQSAICRFEKLDITPKSAAKIKPVLEKWMQDAEKKYADRLKHGSQQHFAELIGDMNSKKRKRRTSFTPKALDKLNKAFEVNTHPSGSEMTALAQELDYDREVIRVWFCNKRQALKNNFKRMRSHAENDYSALDNNTQTSAIQIPESATANCDFHLPLMDQQHHIPQEPLPPVMISSSTLNDQMYQLFDPQQINLNNDDRLVDGVGQSYPNHYSHPSSSIGSEQLSFTSPVNYIHPLDHQGLNIFHEESGLNDGMDFFDSLLQEQTSDDDLHFLDSLMNDCGNNGNI
ncbi:hypothetical protein ACOME3_002104 [Neoechinorhynchus agilis]